MTEQQHPGPDFIDPDADDPILRVPDEQLDAPPAAPAPPIDEPGPSPWARPGTPDQAPAHQHLTSQQSTPPKKSTTRKKTRKKWALPQLGGQSAQNSPPEVSATSLAADGESEHRFAPQETSQPAHDGDTKPQITASSYRIESVERVPRSLAGSRQSPTKTVPNKTIPGALLWTLLLVGLGATALGIVPQISGHNHQSPITWPSQGTYPSTTSSPSMKPVGGQRVPVPTFHPSIQDEGIFLLPQFSRGAVKIGEGYPKGLSADRRVLAYSDAGSDVLIGVDLRTHQQRWTARTDVSCLKTPVTRRGRVFCLSFTGNGSDEWLMSLNVNSGKQTRVAVIPHGVTLLETLADGDDGAFFRALDSSGEYQLVHFAANGSLQWTVRLGDGAQCQAESNYIVCTQEDRTVAFTRDTGRKTLDLRTGTLPILASDAVIMDLVGQRGLATRYDGTPVAELSDVWRLCPYHAGTVVPVTLDDYRTLGGYQDVTVCLDATGKSRAVHTLDLDGTVLFPSQHVVKDDVSDDMLSSDGRVYAYTTHTNGGELALVDTVTGRSIDTIPGLTSCHAESGVLVGYKDQRSAIYGPK